MRRPFIFFPLLIALPLICGCGRGSDFKMEYVQKPQPDDLELSVRNLRYDATVSGYTFAYNADHPGDPCEPTTWVYISKDALVATRAISPLCLQANADFSRIRLRHDWNAPSTRPTTQAMESVPALPAQHPGR